jgi:signal transduction histidine kinase
MNKTWLRRGGVGLAVAAMMILGSLDLVQHYYMPVALALALSAARSVPILIYRRHPYLAWWLAFASSVAVIGATLFTGWGLSEPWPWAVSSMALLAPMTGVLAAQGSRVHTVVAVVLIGALGGIPAFGIGMLSMKLTAIVCTFLCVVAAVLGDIVYSRSRVVGQLAEEKQVSAAERTRRSMIEERARIARELHDVVAHHMSMITVQAETARYRLAGLPDPVVAEFSGIAELARGSLTELRGLLTALRDEQDAPALAPQPTLADVGELAERITATGTPVRLTMTGEIAGLPDAVQVSAYRIVQESLSNVARHAGGTPTSVDISVDTVVAVEVVNGRPERQAPRDGEGHGLLGLRERTTLLGGTLDVDQPDGGWRVRATLPVDGAPVREEAR